MLIVLSTVAIISTVRYHFSYVYSTHSNFMFSKFLDGPDSEAWFVGSILLINGSNKVVI